MKQFTIISAISSSKTDGCEIEKCALTYFIAYCIAYLNHIVYIVSPLSSGYKGPYIFTLRYSFRVWQVYGRRPTVLWSTFRKVCSKITVKRRNCQFDWRRSLIYHTARPPLSGQVVITLRRSKCRGEIFWSPEFGARFKKEVPLYLLTYPYTLCH